MNDLKLYCVVSKEAVTAMKGNRGKLAAQCGHAYLHAFWDAQKRFPEMANHYQNLQERAYKICLVVETAKEFEVLMAFHENKCGVTIVEDAALTVFDEPTVTCMGIGPIDPARVSEKLKNLKVFI
jgi:peptidyl-tRNA hydrolase